MGDVVDRAVLKQPELANILEAIGKGGPDAFYKGDIAKAITSDIQNNGGILSEDDMASYKPIVWDKGLEFKYRGHTVRVPPFACAGITSAMTLKLLDGFDVPSMAHNSADMLHAYISCARLAYADRFQYLADPAFADVPWNGLVSDDYTELRRATIGDRMNGSVEAGNPWIQEGREPTSVLPASRPAEDKGTTHLVVTDSEGNGVSITNTSYVWLRLWHHPQGHRRRNEQRHDVVRSRARPHQLHRSRQTAAEQHDTRARYEPRRRQNGSRRVWRKAHYQLRNSADYQGPRLRHGSPGRDRLPKNRLQHAPHEHRPASRPRYSRRAGSPRP